jgi:hypothetical protein
VASDKFLAASGVGDLCARELDGGLLARDGGREVGAFSSSAITLAAFYAVADICGSRISLPPRGGRPSRTRASDLRLHQADPIAVTERREHRAHGGLPMVLRARRAAIALGCAAAASMQP